MTTIALTRAVSPRIAECELTFRKRESIDAERAAREHEEYERRLEEHGWSVVRADAEPDLPDSVFVEDGAVVLDEIAVIARPGAEARLPETESLARMLAAWRDLRFLESPARLDGGDVLRLGRTLHVGIGGRTNAAGARQLRAHAAPFGYTVVETPFTGCLHLKSAVTPIGENTILVNPRRVDPSAFDAEAIEADPAEPDGANALILAPTILLLSASARRTGAELEDRGFRVVTIDIRELERAEAGVTCCSILFEARTEGRDSEGDAESDSSYDASG